MGNYMDETKKLCKIYEDFTKKVQSLGSKAKGGKRSSKFAGSFAHWIGGSHIKTEREVFCEQFLEDVQEQLEIIWNIVNESDDVKASKICNEVAEILMETRDALSDSTTDLMKRAMIGQVEPFLPYVSKEKLTQLKSDMENAYGIRKMLPVEKNIYKAVKKLLA
mgnify:CR=1 FL=1